VRGDIGTGHWCEDPEEGEGNKARKEKRGEIRWEENKSIILEGSSGNVVLVLIMLSETPAVLRPMRGKKKRRYGEKGGGGMNWGPVTRGEGSIKIRCATAVKSP